MTPIPPWYAAAREKEAARKLAVEVEIKSRLGDDVECRDGGCKGSSTPECNFVIVWGSEDLGWGSTPAMAWRHALDQEEDYDRIDR